VGHARSLGCLQGAAPPPLHLPPAGWRRVDRFAVKLSSPSFVYSCFVISFCIIWLYWCLLFVLIGAGRDVSQKKKNRKRGTDLARNSRESDYLSLEVVRQEVQQARRPSGWCWTSWWRTRPRRAWPWPACSPSPTCSSCASPRPRAPSLETTVSGAFCEGPRQAVPMHPRLSACSPNGAQTQLAMGLMATRVDAPDIDEDFARPP
jgi:hypothetical protein